MTEERMTVENLMNISWRYEVIELYRDGKWLVIDEITNDGLPKGVLGIGHVAIVCDVVTYIYNTIDLITVRLSDDDDSDDDDSDEIEIELTKYQQQMLFGIGHPDDEDFDDDEAYPDDDNDFDDDVTIVEEYPKMKHRTVKAISLGWYFNQYPSTLEVCLSDNWVKVSGIDYEENNPHFSNGDDVVIKSDGNDYRYHIDTELQIRFGNQQVIDVLPNSHPANDWDLESEYEDRFLSDMDFE